MELQFAKRPTASSLAANQKGGVVKPLPRNLEGRKVSLLTNYYKFEFINPNKNNVFKYHVKFTPEISDNSKTVRCKLVNGLRS